MTDIPEKIRKSLDLFGFSESKISKFQGESLLVQDLGIWGDDFDDLYPILTEVYGTDPKIDEKCAPPENSVWIAWNPFKPLRKTVKAEPLSLLELDRIMSTGDPIENN